MPNIRRMGYLLALIIGTALVVAIAWNPAPPPRFAGLNDSEIPRTLEGYTAAQDDLIAPEVRTALASADLISRTYTQGTDDINFVLIGGADRSALHDPRSCLIGAGMQLENDHQEMLPEQAAAQSCRAVSAGTPGFDILYLYIINGKVVTEPTQIRTAMLWSALLGSSSTHVYFLRFLRTASTDPAAEAESHNRLQKFAAAMWTTLKPKLMK